MTRQCIICKKEIEQLHPDLKDSTPWMCMWKGGVVDKVAANYGSIYDGDVFVIAICDTCITENKSSIEFIYNYLNLEGDE